MVDSGRVLLLWVLDWCGPIATYTGITLTHLLHELCLSPDKSISNHLICILKLILILLIHNMVLWEYESVKVRIVTEVLLNESSRVEFLL